MTDFAKLGILVDTRGLTQADRDFLKFDNNFRTTEAQTKKSTGLMGQSMTKFAATAGTALAGAAAAFLSFQAAAGSVSNARDFNAALAESSTLIEGTAAEMDEMSSSARTLAKDFGGDATTQVKAFYQAISAGAGSVTDATGLLDQANRLAIGGAAEVTTAVDILTSAMNVYVDEGLSAADTSDALFVAMKAGKTTIEELATTLGKVLPLAQKLGVSFDETTATVAALTKGGIATSQAVTGVQAAMTSVLKPSKEASDLAADLSLNFNAAAVEAKGFAAFMADVVAKTNGSSEAMSILFGSVEATTVALALSGAAGGFLSDILGDMATKTGQTDEAFQKMASSLDKRWGRAVAATGDLALGLGNTLLTVLVPVLETTSDLFVLAAENSDLLAISLGFLAVTQVPAVVRGLVSLTAWLATSEGLFIAGAAAAKLYTLAINTIPFVAVGTAIVATSTMIYRGLKEERAAVMLLKTEREELNRVLGVYSETSGPAARDAALDGARASEAAARATLLELEATRAKLLVGVDDGSLQGRALQRRLSTIATIDGPLGEARTQLDSLQRSIQALATDFDEVPDAANAATGGVTETADAFKALNDAADNLGSTVDTTHDMADGFAILADQIRTAGIAQRELSEIDAVRGISAVISEVNLLKNDLGLTSGEVSNLSSHLRYIEQQDTFVGQAEALASIVLYLDAATGGAENMNAAARSVYEALLSSLNTAISISQVNMVAPINSAVTSANQLAHQFGIAYGYASALATMEVSSGEKLTLPGVAPMGGEGSGTDLQFSSTSFTMPKVKLDPFVAPNIPSVGGGGSKGRGGGGGETEAQKERNDLMEDGVKITEDLWSEQEKFNDAISQADRLLKVGAITQDTYNQHVAQLGKEFAEIKFETLIDGVTKVTDGLIDAAFAGDNLLESFLKTMLEMEIAALKSNLKDILTDQLTPDSGGGGFLGFLGKALIGGFTGSATPDVKPSFDGGGYTGNGPRTGGIDGKGGFDAVLHPGEMVTDLTKTQDTSTGSSGGRVEVIVRAADGVTIEEVVNTANAIVRQAQPETIAAVGKAMKRTKRFGN